jgi:cytoskeletal protein RodZ
VPLDDLADATRIARHHLEALERSDLQALPPGPFGKGYVRSCAKALGIDAEPLLESYRALERQRGLGGAEGERRMLDEMAHLVGHRSGAQGRPVRRTATAGAVALAITGLAVAGAVGWSLARGRAHAPSASSSPAPSRPRPATAAAKPPESPTARVVTTAKPAAARTAHAVAPPRPARAAKAEEAALVVATDGIEISHHGVGSGLLDRRLVGESDHFVAGSQVAFWTLVVGGRRGHVIRHVWYRNGRPVATAELPVGGPHWRTFSRVFLPAGAAGQWAVEAQTADGRLLARDEFVCEAAR